MLEKQGQLTKIGYKSGKWQDRVFALHSDGSLVYSTAKGAERGRLQLTGQSTAEAVRPGSELDATALAAGVAARQPIPAHSFKVTVVGSDGSSSRSYYLAAESDTDRTSWLQALRDAILKRNKRILLLGLDGAGKTAILQYHKEGKPTVGFSVESVNYDGITIQYWDVGCMPKIRMLWRNYVEHINAVVFVVNAAETDRWPEARQFFDEIVSTRELADCRYMVVANKQDLAGAATPEEVGKMLGVERLDADKCECVAASAKTGQGVEALKALGDQIVGRND